jgi:hypothetical protein
MSDGASPLADAASQSPVPISDIEAQKLDLEKEKLAFEKLKFEAERSKREKDLEKLDQEIREYKLPIWRKSSSIGAIATIFVALVAGLLTFGTDIFKSNIRSLIADRSKLKAAVVRLTVEQSALRSNAEALRQQTQTLSQEKQALSEKQAALILDRNSLLRSTASLRTQKANLQHEVLVAPIKTQMSLLETEDQLNVFVLTPALPSDAAIKTLSDAVVGQKNDASLIQLVENYFDTAKYHTTKAAIALILFRATGRVKWRSEILTEAAADLDVNSFFQFHNLDYYLRLLGASDLFFLPQEKVEVLKTLYLRLAKEPAKDPDLAEEAKSPELAEAKAQLAANQRSFTITSFCSVAKWDRDATVTFRDPWFACQKGLLEELPADLSLDSDRQRDSVRLFEFSQEIYGIALLRQTELRGVTAFKDGEVVPTGYLPTAKAGCPAFQQSFPLCVDWATNVAPPTDSDAVFRIWFKSFPAYAQWLRENEAVATALLDPEHKALSKVSEDVMGKVFDGVWITQSDLGATDNRR